jgi:large subunit ribosomal protein L23
MPGKSKTRNTKRGAIQGRIPSYKKAIVTLASGEEINFFGEETQEEVGE